MDLKTGTGLWTLLQMKGIGPKRAIAIADHFGTWERFSNAAAWEHKQVLGAAAKGVTEQALAAGPQHPDLPDGVRMLCQFDDEWPRRLTKIPDPPALLWAVGAPLPAGGVAVVGTRQPTGYGTAVAQMVATAAAERGIATVSGLALGVDTLAHEACIAAGAPTWAVLGQGVDTLVDGPRADLSRLIVERGGGLVAEVAPGSPVEPRHLIRRNRLQSALSDAVVIAQSGLPRPGTPAGTMHTARYAVAQGRILAVARPHGNWAADPRSAGNLALTDPGGCPPEAVHATDRTDIARCDERRPYADIVLRGREDLPLLWDAVSRSQDAPDPLPAP